MMVLPLKAFAILLHEGTKGLRPLTYKTQRYGFRRSVGQTGSCSSSYQRGVAAVDLLLNGFVPFLKQQDLFHKNLRASGIFVDTHNANSLPLF